MTRDNVTSRHSTLQRGTDDLYHPLNPVGIYGYTRQRQLFVQLLRRAGVDLQGARILDLGSGTGEWTRFFAELKDTPEGITGLEYNAASIEYARALSPITYVQGDMTDLSVFADGSFDFISVFVALMFLPDLAAVQDMARQIARVLASNGLFFISELNEPHRPDKPFSGFPREGIQQAVRPYNFDLIAQQSVFKNFLGWRKLSSYYRIRFGLMDWMPTLERIVPGRPAYYYQLYRYQP